MAVKNYPQTPDGKYFVAQGRLWRKSDPRLSEKKRQKLVNQLMQARRDIASAKADNDEDALKEARERVHENKLALGERGEVWWNDGESDVNQKKPENTRYADWWESLSKKEKSSSTQ